MVSTSPPPKEWEEISIEIPGTRKPVHNSHEKPKHDIHKHKADEGTHFIQGTHFVLAGQAGEEGTNTRGDPKPQPMSKLG